TGQQFTQFECNQPNSLTNGILLTFTQPPCITPTVTPTLTGTPPTSTGTVTPTFTPTNTPTAPACGTNANYAVTQGTGSLIGGTVDSGNHCDACTVPITLPFPFKLYGQTFTTANIDDNGTLQF